MDSEPDQGATLVIQVVGWTGVVDPRVEILVDGRPVGALSDRRARSLPVGAGARRVTARCGSLRSRALLLRFTEGEQASMVCGFRAGVVVASKSLLIALNLASVALIGTDSTGRGSTILAALILLVIAVDLLVMCGMPGGYLSLRSSGAPDPAWGMPERMDAPCSTSGTQPARPRLQIGLSGMLLIVACSAVIFLVARQMWDQRPANRPAPALRQLRSRHLSSRLAGTSELGFLVIGNSLSAAERDTAVSGLLAALRDRYFSVRVEAAKSLQYLLLAAERRRTPVPRAEEVVAGLAEGIRDSGPLVRQRCALALAGFYSSPWADGEPGPPLPRDTGRFVGLLREASQDPDPAVRSFASSVLRAIESRLVESPAASAPTAFAPG